MVGKVPCISAISPFPSPPHPQTPPPHPRTTLPNVQTPVDGCRDGPDFRPQLLLDPPQVASVVLSDQVDSKSQVAEPTTPTDPVQIRLAVLGEVEVDDDIDTLDVDTASEQIARDQVAGGSVAELVEDAVPVGLLHFGVNVEAAVAKLGDLFGQEFNSVNAVLLLRVRCCQQRSLAHTLTHSLIHSLTHSLTCCKR